MADAVIKVEGLSKRYHIGATKGSARRQVGQALGDIAMAPLRRLKSFGRSSHREEDTIWALRDVSFQVRRGEVLGLIGANGAGKSTLLKILSRITDPTEGRAEIRGRVGSLLEAGTGFHKELTGRENVYLSGAILGMSKREIDARFDEIAGFSGVAKFLDTPIKRYSSGMRVRLGFAVAAHLEPEVLLVDEVLAVGDAAFQKKCLGKIRDTVRGGSTVILVSHRMPSVQTTCSRVIVLEGGYVVFDGSTQEGIGLYVHRALEEGGAAPARSPAFREGSGRVRIQDVVLRDSEGRASTRYLSGRPQTVVLNVLPDESFIGSVGASLTIYDESGMALTHLNSKAAGFPLSMAGKRCAIVCEIPELPLARGSYYVNVALHCEGERLAHVPGAVHFDVVEGDFFGSGAPLPAGTAAFLVHHSWSVEQ